MHTTAEVYETDSGRWAVKLMGQTFNTMHDAVNAAVASTREPSSSFYRGNVMVYPTHNYGEAR